MECVYNAANTLEGQLALALLKGVGIDARMDGEYLQGGIGELQALGIIRILVVPDDAAKAQAILRQWDQMRAPESAAPGQSPRSVFIVVVGVVLGVGVALLAMMLSARA
ncbi:DUF2007 domain-containing protein [Gilvimarinus sp. SDUM040013]|uniref:DUF2007 domain-containing protein n=1 Tax=Gilvimarinus gilvus TaxID=3058038 RepID=A0ABU4RZB1_9GAMM|nr:DUF2007 domain-containing protein [Gilvimarinus sp. SDUM040013]MDO3386348.1 DUF2007 domain-containing protein [Gilvimarinus sp. SDUM040013]MDX6849994.1 DUF2007 domain-containing protein [Gilvimarinus sp. SDUM040013]